MNSLIMFGILPPPGLPCGCNKTPVDLNREDLTGIYRAALSE